MTEAVLTHDKDYNFKRKTDTPESKAFWESVDDASWKVNHLWPTWKVGEGYFKEPRVEVTTKKDLEEFLEKEGYALPDTDFFEIILHKNKFLFVIDGENVRVYSSTYLFK